MYAAAVALRDRSTKPISSTIPNWNIAYEFYFNFCFFLDNFSLISDIIDKCFVCFRSFSFISQDIYCLTGVLPFIYHYIFHTFLFFFLWMWLPLFVTAALVTAALCDCRFLWLPLFVTAAFCDCCFWWLPLFVTAALVTATFNDASTFVFYFSCLIWFVSFWFICMYTNKPIPYNPSGILLYRYPLSRLIS